MNGFVLIFLILVVVGLVLLARALFSGGKRDDRETRRGAGVPSEDENLLREIREGVEKMKERVETLETILVEENKADLADLEKRSQK
jgi:phage shock protein B